MTTAFDTKNLTQETRMADLVKSNLNLLFVLNQFSLPLGFGDKSIMDVCNEYKVGPEEFLTLLLFHGNPDNPDKESLLRIKPATILSCLKNAHTYFLDYRLPLIRKQIAGALTPDNTSKTILRYFDEYAAEVKDHMSYENEVFFPYVENLLADKKNGNYTVREYEMRHNNIEEKLDMLINLLVKFLPSAGPSFLLADAVESIKTCNRDLNLHTYLEDDILIPQIHALENTPVSQEAKPVNNQEDELSEREKEIVRSVAQGMSNKQIADIHFISIHTVITHRRNISRKLGIHSSAGLVIYAILNNLVTIEELRQ